MILIATDGLNKELCIAAYLFYKEVIRIGRGSGWLHLALYLRQCSSSLMIAYGGGTHVPSHLPVPISLNRSGYPRIIPSFHRRAIIRKDDGSDQLLRLYLSFFSLCKRIFLFKRVTGRDYDSIRNPVKDIHSVVSLMGRMRPCLRG